MRKRKIFLFGLLATLPFAIASCDANNDNVLTTPTSGESTVLPTTSLTPAPVATTTVPVVSTTVSVTSTNSPTTTQTTAPVVTTTVSSTTTVQTTIPEYTDEQKAVLLKADNAITWQIPNVGGWDKDYANHIKTPRGDQPYNKKSGWLTKDGGYLGTIDNDATYSHMYIIAEAYEISKDQKYKDSFDFALEFLDHLQTEKGGFTQVYPERGNYSDYVTFNDDAMANVMKMLKKMYKAEAPFKSILNDEERQTVKKMFDDGIDYILKSQIIVNGEKSGWCAQHDPETYEARHGREYERASISGSESMGVIELLLEQTENQKCIDAGMAALRWFDAHKLVDKAFDKNGKVNAETGKLEYIYTKSGSTIWYRFYDLNGVGFFSDRATFTDESGNKVPNEAYNACDGYFYDVSQISEERRKGYSWMGTWPKNLIEKYLSK